MHPNNHTNPAPIRPQNPSCPAGGSLTQEQSPKPVAGAGGRGITIASPSRNTDDPKRYTVLHRGFDTLALSIQAHIGPDLFEFLTAEKERADQEDRDVLTEYGGLQFFLKPYGGKGYAFLLDCGPDGARLAIKKPNPKNKWGITITYGSFFLALHGLGAAKANSEDVLRRLGVTYGPDDVSISRVDFCVDILANGFQLNPDQLVMHSATKRADYLTHDASDLRINGKSGRVTSVTAGSISNRQIIIYNKRAEVVARGKTHWWDIWNDTLSKGTHGNGAPDILYKGKPARVLTPDSEHAKDNQVWRVEFRAGKALLKDRWGIRTWQQLFDRYGDLCREAGRVVRYCEPDPDDSNRARWPNHPLWETACAEINDDLTEMRSGADPNPMKEVHREQHINTLFRNLLGSSITLAALHGKSHDDLPDMFAKTAQDMTDAAKADSTKTERQLREAKERYIFITGPTPPH